jgi:hypothetical protein
LSGGQADASVWVEFVGHATGCGHAMSMICVIAGDGRKGLKAGREVLEAG